MGGWETILLIIRLSQPPAGDWLGLSLAKSKSRNSLVVTHRSFVERGGAKFISMPPSINVDPYITNLEERSSKLLICGVFCLTTNLFRKF